MDTITAYISRAWMFGDHMSPSNRALFGVQEGTINHVMCLCRKADGKHDVMNIQGSFAGEGSIDGNNNPLYISLGPEYISALNRLMIACDMYDRGGWDSKPIKKYIRDTIKSGPYVFIDKHSCDEMILLNEDRKGIANFSFDNETFELSRKRKIFGLF